MQQGRGPAGMEGQWAPGTYGGHDPNKTHTQRTITTSEVSVVLLNHILTLVIWNNMLVSLTLPSHRFLFGCPVWPNLELQQNI